MQRTLGPHLLVFLKAFLWGTLIFGLVYYLFLGWPLSLETAIHSARSGLLTALLWVGNGFISDAVKVSWIDYPVRRLVISAVLTIVVTYVAGVLTDVIIDLVVNGRVTKASLTISKDFFLSLLVITFFISLFMHGRQFLLNYKASIIAQEELKRANLASRYESLQNQVNPHFLFNSLNVLSNLVYKDADLSAKFIQQLAEVYRYVLEARDQEVVSLQAEKEMLMAYLFLLKIRFGDQFLVEVNLNPSPEDALPPLVLQMVVENAVKHNVVSRRHPLTLEIRKEGDRILVRNNLQIKQQVQTSLGVGLNNIRSRYGLLSDQAVEIVEGPDYYQVSLPLLKVKEYARVNR